MSLINDALKRATKAQAEQPPAPAVANTMQPVSGRRSSGLPMYFTPVLLFVISGASWFILKGWEAQRQSGLYPDPIIVHARENSVGTPETAPVQSSSSAETQPSVESLIPPVREFALNDTPAAPVATRPSPASAVAAPDSPVPDETKSGFRLQGIFYRPTRPSAVVNNKTVYVGDLIASGRVKAISHESVTIVVDGETKVLTLQ